MDTIILIPTYFGGRMLQNCLDSIFENVSSAQVQVYKNEDGWLKAANKMMESVNTDVILLNDDTVVLTDIVKEMHNLAYSDPKIGIVGAKMLSPNQETVINYGIYIGSDGNTAHKHYGEHRSKVTKVETQKAVEGSCIFIKREVLDKIGIFDEGYGAGIREEVDLCFRAREAGYKVMSTPKAEVVHFVSQTHGRLGITDNNFEYFLSRWGKKLKLGKI